MTVRSRISPTAPTTRGGRTSMAIQMFTPAPFAITAV